MQILSPGTRIGQYEIASIPMVGGMGVVYFALDHGNDGRPVALKTFRPELLPDRAARDRFLREGTAWIELGSHPHIVRCYKVEYIDPTAFLVLELIAKEQNMPDASLRSWLIPGQPLPLEQALLFALQIARGMQYATEKIPGFVHRDLKPENILVGADRLPDTNINRLRVTDFGLVKTIVSGDMSAKAGNDEELKPNQVQFTRGVGTPLYMSPEQWQGNPTGVFTDVYAFGCILYEMLSGQFSVSGRTITELQISHCEGISLYIPTGWSTDVIALIDKCRRLNPAERFESWDDVVAMIEHAYEVHNGESSLQILSTAESSRGERLNIGWSYYAIGAAYMDLGNTSQSEDYFQRCYSIGEDDASAELTSVAIGGLSIIRRNRGEYEEAIGYANQQLSILREHGDQIRQKDVFNTLGNIYTEIGNTRQAISYYEKAVAISQSIGDKNGIGIAFGNLSIAYSQIGDWEHAIGFSNQHLQLSQELGNKRMEGNALSTLGNIYEDLGDSVRAMRYHEQSLLVFQTIGDREGEGLSLGNIGISFYQLGDFKRAIDFYQKSLSQID